MNALALRNISKKYLIHRHKKLADLISRRSSSDVEFEEEFWAIKNISFEVAQGSTFGIIGSNGAGKSTILKLMSGITYPTSGTFEINGSLAALIEVGAGFHPDLTGRENVYLNGSILGLSKAEIGKKFDEIVEFAELEQFIDTPVKRFSSGMYVRLGFSVAVHIETDILLVDEVLSVGDMAFQRKCLRRMHEIKDRGRTIVFITHNLETMQNICNEAIWLDRGQIKMQGNPKEIVSSYIEETDFNILSSEYHNRDKYYESTERWGTGDVKLEKVKVTDLKGDPALKIVSSSGLDIIIEYSVKETIKKPVFWISISGEDNTKVAGATTMLADICPHDKKSVKNIRCRIKSLPLQSGIYYINVGVFNESCNVAYDRWGKVHKFMVVPGSLKDSGIRNPDFYGHMMIEDEWKEGL